MVGTSTGKTLRVSPMCWLLNLTGFISCLLICLSLMRASKFLPLPVHWAWGEWCHQYRGPAWWIWSVKAIKGPLDRNVTEENQHGPEARQWLYTAVFPVWIQTASNPFSWCELKRSNAAHQMLEATVIYSSEDTKSNTGQLTAAAAIYFPPSMSWLLSWQLDTSYSYLAGRNFN